MELSRSLHCLTALLLFANGIYAQHRIAGKVVSSDGQHFEAIISLFAGDSLVGAALTDGSGRFAFGDMKAATYRLTVLEPAYQPVTDSVILSSDINKNYTIFPIATLNLEEVTVTADRSGVVRQTATGSVFRLSDTAKERGNAFDALSEIPELVVNVTERSVRLSSGTAPLILVNGVRSANGINNIDPKDIESVEVIQVPSARYTGEAEAALNIKVTRKRYAYYSASLTGRHSLPGVFGFSDAGMETGGEKYILYLTGQHFYFHDDAGRITSTQENAGYHKSSVTDGNYNSSSLYAALGGDYVFSARDYLPTLPPISPTPAGQTITGAEHICRTPSSHPLRPLSAAITTTTSTPITCTTAIRSTTTPSSSPPSALTSTPTVHPARGAKTMRAVAITITSTSTITSVPHLPCT
jgi:hypothetical protein